MSIRTNITPFLFDNSGTTLAYPANLSLRGFNINLSGTTNNSVLVYEDTTNQYEPIEGTEINDEIRKSFVYPLNNLLERLNTTLFTQVNNTTITDTAAETSLLGFGIGSKTLPTEFLTFGKTIKIEMWGKVSTNNTNRNVNIRYKLGSTEIGQTGTVTLPNVTNETFKIEIITTSRFIGVSGVTTTQGFITIHQGTPSSPIELDIHDVNLSGTVISNASILPIDVTWQWVTANINNTVTSTNTVIKRYN